jgi:pimeloyl-ACP methyl ester carboxylesterase
VEATAEDIMTVMDAACSRRVLLIGASEGGPSCIRFAASHPERLAGLVLFGSLAKGSWTPLFCREAEANPFRLNCRHSASKRLQQVRGLECKGLLTVTSPSCSNCFNTHSGSLSAVSYSRPRTVFFKSDHEHRPLHGVAVVAPPGTTAQIHT